MKSINTLSIFITLCLTLVITLILSSMTVRAAELPKTQLEKVETLNKAIFTQQAMQTIASSMASLQLNTTNDDILNTNSLVAKQISLNKTNTSDKVINVTDIAD